MGEQKRFKDVTVTWDETGVHVDPPVTHLFYTSGPDSVRWKIKGKRPPATRIKITWEKESPLGKISTAREDEVLGTDNRHVRGSYTYAVLLVDQQGQVVAGVDPLIINEPGPPAF